MTWYVYQYILRCADNSEDDVQAGEGSQPQYTISDEGGALEAGAELAPLESSMLQRALKLLQQPPDVVWAELQRAKEGVQGESLLLDGTLQLSEQLPVKGLVLPSL